MRIAESVRPIAGGFVFSALPGLAGDFLLMNTRSEGNEGASKQVE